METCKYCGKQRYYGKCYCRDLNFQKSKLSYDERNLEIENLYFFERKTYQEIANKYNLGVAYIKKLIWP